MTYITREKISITSAIGVNSDSVTSGGNWYDAATYTGQGEENDYAYVGVNLQVDEPGLLFFDFSQDGAVWSPYPVNGFIVASGINEVHTAWKGGRYMRPRFIGDVGSRTYFRLETYYSNLPLPLSAPLNQSISADQDAQVVRAVAIGEDPQGNYTNEKVAGKAFETTTNLNSGETYKSGNIDITQYQQVQTQIVCNENGTLKFIFGNSEFMTGETVGVNGVDRVISLPYEAAKGFESFSAPAFTDYVRYEFTNDGASVTTHLFFDTKLLTTALSGQVLTTNSPIASAMVANLGRNIQVGKDINGNFNNLPSSSTDDNNTTTTPLGISATFTGGWSFVEPYGEIKVSVVTDAPAANCFLQLSNDGVNVQTSLNLPPQLVAGKYRFIHSLNPSLPYFRVVYDNGTVAQRANDSHNTACANW
jgi:hypothetical protein